MTPEGSRAVLRSELLGLGRALARARARERALAAQAAEAVRRGGEADIPETEMAELVRVDRMTVRAWLGKRRPTR